MANNAFMMTEIVGHGAYLCLRRTGDASAEQAARAPIEALAARLGLRNEFDPGETPPADSIAFLRRHGATPADIADDGLLRADAVVHVASPRADPVDALCAEAARLLPPSVEVRVLRGVRRPRSYTSGAMAKWAYERQVIQQPAAAMPNAFIVPMRKTDEWWKKDWMERHTYFLPTYDADGRMRTEGHALVTEAGIACLLRRTYQSADHPAPAGDYDFVSYFECADNEVPVFDQICAALRDVARNPEWRFVREGPTWRGRRVATWRELFA